MSWRRRLLRWTRGARTAGAALPDGLWRTDFARIDRACQRFVQVSAGRAEWDEVLAVMLATRAQAWQRCVAAAARDPRRAAEVPGDPEEAALHRGLAQAAVQCAQVAQAVVMARTGTIGTVPAARAAARAFALVSR